MRLRFDSVRDQIYEHMQWIHDNLYSVAAADVRARRIDMSRQLFDENNDPELAWRQAASEFNALAMQAIVREDWAEKNIVHLKRSMENLLKRFEGVIARLRELETFFQPAVLALICEYANQYDNPRKRRYVPGLLCLTCKRAKGYMGLQARER